MVLKVITNDEKIQWCLLFVVFLSMMLFFTLAHPLVLFDGDDWKDMGELRSIAFPKWHDWNPTKVLPETIMALTGYLGAYVFAPLAGDYMTGISFAAALVLSLFITVYIGMMERLLQYRFKLSAYTSSLISLIFLCLHFLVFKDAPEGNAYLFGTANLTCVFHYIIPFLANASLVLAFIAYDIRGDYSFKTDHDKNGLLIFAIFLALYSSIFFSVILASYILWKFLCDFKLKSKAQVLEYCRKNSLYTGILAAWGISLIFEANGRRAASLNEATLPVVDAFNNFAHIFLSGNKGLVIVAVIALLFIGGAFLWSQFKDKESPEKNIYRALSKQTFFCIFFWLVYTVLISAKADPAYIGRPDVQTGFFFFFFFLMTVALGYLLKRKSGLLLVLPILFFMIFCRTVNGDRGYAPSTVNRIPESTCIAISNDIIRQFKEADNNHLDNFILHVPEYETKDNWPQTMELYARRVNNQLAAHGIVSRHFNVQVVKDVAMNERYGLKKP